MKPLLYSSTCLVAEGLGDAEENATGSLPQGVYNLVENKLYNMSENDKISKGGLDESWTLRRKGDGRFCDGREVL